MKNVIAAILVLLSAAGLLASDKSVAGVYWSEVGLYVLTVSLLDNGNYLAGGIRTLARTAQRPVRGHFRMVRCGSPRRKKRAIP